MDEVKMKQTAYILYEEQRHLCGCCGVKLQFFNSQLAHKIPQRKNEIERYGVEVIHHKGNLTLVCSLYCNNKMQAPSNEWPVIALDIEKGVYGPDLFTDSMWES